MFIPEPSKFSQTRFKGPHRSGTNVRVSAAHLVRRAFYHRFMGGCIDSSLENIIGGGRGKIRTTKSTRAKFFT